MNAVSISFDRLPHLRHLEAYLHEQIRGQDHIPRVISVLQRGELGLTKAGQPRGSFLLLGPTGVGKTELSIPLAVAFTDSP
jgi:ATP-dependent Clp protease ATP-binding subunit ClpA